MATVQLFDQEARTLRRFDAHQPGTSRREHRVDLLLRRCSIRRSKCWRRCRARSSSGSAAAGRERARSRSACSWRSSSTRAGSSSRSPTCPRSSTSSRPPWRPPSGSSACSTPSRRSCRPGTPSRRRRRAGASSSTTSGLPTTTSSASCGTSRSSIEPGQRVGIVGATGSGKTTIINLLLRFYDVQRGRVLVDGVDVRDWDPHGPAPAVRPGAAGRPPVLRHDCRQHPAGRPAIDDDGGQRARRRPCTPTQFIAARPGGYRLAGRRARRDAVGRPEAAAVVRARAGVRSAVSCCSTRRRRASTRRPRG